MYQINLLSAFAKLPWWQMLLVFAALKVAIPTGRLILEGKFYDISLASVFGEAALFIVATLGFFILKSGQATHLPGFLSDGRVQSWILVGSVVIGMVTCIKTLRSREGQLMDVYHDVVVAPLLLYLAINLLPVIVMNGKAERIILALCGTGFWLWTIAYDVKFDLLKQRRELRRRGVTGLRANFNWRK